MNAVERDEFLLTDDFKSFISKTKRVMGDASKMEQDFARTNTKFQNLLKRNKWLLVCKVKRAFAKICSIMKITNALKFVLSEIENKTGHERAVCRDVAYIEMVEALETAIYDYKNIEIADVIKVMTSAE